MSDDNKIEDLRIIAAEIKESIKYMDKRLDSHDQEIKGLHRENSKQAEEIKDSMYLSDTLRLKLEHYDKNCLEHKTCFFNDCKKNEQNFINLEERIDLLGEKIDQSSIKKLTLIISTIVTTLVTIFGIIGALFGWIQIGR